MTHQATSAHHPSEGDGRLLELANRRFIYALLARALAEEADETYREVFCGDHAASEIALADASADGLEAAFAQARKTMRDSALERLREEYARIFIGPERLPVAPYESVFLTGKRVLFQPSVLEVRRSYREAGFLPARLHSVPDDFIGLEMDFMAKLADAAFRAWQQGDESACERRLEQSKRFLEDHLNHWVGDFAQQVGSKHGACFYEAVLRMAARYCMADPVLLQE